MKAHKALCITLLIVTLLCGPFLSAFSISPVLAETSTGQTTLYFVDALNYLGNENTSEFASPFMSLSAPTKKNDSEYPPSLFIKNTSRPIPRNELNLEQLLLWGSTWLMDFFKDFEGFDFEGFDIFEGYEILIPNPYRVVEGYPYNGNESITITGDVFYHLFFHTEIKNKKFRDNVEVELYSFNMEEMYPPPKLIAKKNVTLTPPFLGDIYNQQITLSDVHFTLQPGESLLCSVEIIPSNKTIATVITKHVDINRFITRLEKLANWMENRTRLEKIQSLGTTLKEFIVILNESLVNITSADFAAILNALRSSSFIYDSVGHPSSVSIPGKISAEDIRTFYLHADRTMDEIRPPANNQSQSIKITQTPIVWTTTPALERNKILKSGSVVASLYLDYRDLFRIINILRRRIPITLTLYDDNTTIATSEKLLDRTHLFNLIKKPTGPITFTFNNSAMEITYGHSLQLGVSLKNGTKLGLRTVKLLYDSMRYPSSLKVNFEETQNIKIIDITSSPEDGKIIPGATVDYIMNVSSKKGDTIHFKAIEQETVGAWEINLPDPTTVLANSVTSFHIHIKSKNNLKEAYGNSIYPTIIVQGNTGIDRQKVFAEVSTEAIHYDVEILGYSKNINISKGENRTFYFIIKNNNTGALDDVDSYRVTAVSKNNWPLLPRENIRNVKRGESTAPQDARVVIQVPKKANLSKDYITITVTSEGNSKTSAMINITVVVVSEGFFEEFYNLFDSAAEALGFNDMFGSYGAIVLASILMVIILFLLIILTLVLTTKTVQIICTDRIKEIDATDQAVFDVTLKNPSKKTYSYELTAEQTGPSTKWILTIEPNTVIIDGRQTTTVHITVAPTKDAASKDWTQITFTVKRIEKKKTESIALLTTIKEGKTLLQIQNVSHWPTIFTPGERVTTSFNISNNGTITARNIKIFFYLNGRQRNTAEVTIPAGSIADIQMPWIAEKGKNQVRIRLKEQS